MKPSPNRRRVVDLTKVKDVDWARLAAFIDGEGCILLTSNKNKAGREYQYMSVVITNSDPRLIRWLAELFGGGVMWNKMHQANHRQSYKWKVSCRQAETLLQACLPYFITKRDQADIALAFQATMRGYGRWNNTPASVVELRDQYREQLSAVRWAKHPVVDLLHPKSTVQ